MCQTSLRLCILHLCFSVRVCSITTLYLPFPTVPSQIHLLTSIWGLSFAYFYLKTYSIIASGFLSLHSIKRWHCDTSPYHISDLSYPPSDTLRSPPSNQHSPRETQSRRRRERKSHKIPTTRGCYDNNHYNDGHNQSFSATQSSPSEQSTTKCICCSCCTNGLSCGL